MYHELSWVREARQRYESPGILGETNSTTSPQRARPAIETLEQLLSKNPNIRRPNVLIVGAGKTNGPIICPLVPYIIAGLLESKGLDYAMTVIDLNSQIIGDLRSRTKLFYSTYLTTKEDLTSWQNYCGNTGQPFSYLANPDEEKELIVVDRFKGSRPSYSYESFKDKIAVASIPVSFKEKLGAGDIKLVSGDIATIELPKESFDYADCRFVLYLLSEEGQILALSNMSQSLRIDRYMYIDQFQPQRRSPIFVSNKGWLTNQRAEDLGIELVTTNPQNVDIYTLAQENSVEAHASNLSALFRKVLTA